MTGCDPRPYPLTACSVDATYSAWQGETPMDYQVLVQGYALWTIATLALAWLMSRAI